jgi:hypothetical protein
MFSGNREEQQGRPFDKALNHLNQAESAFDRPEWESANAQSDRVLKVCLIRLPRLVFKVRRTGGAAPRS